ncbi:MAG: RluA family pseudouridine synthase, partial [Acidobacteriota bacterium]|nr:RluA family pseudouridine synthase [Acidobacteriota bacterium]
HLLAVAKPAGLPTMPGGGRFMDNTLWTLVRRRFPDANPLHRLGRGTSGVLLFARTPEAFAVVAKAWNRSEVRKIYRTLVIGSPLANGLGCEFAVDVPIARIPHPVLGTIHAAAPEGGSGAGDEKGKTAHSHVRVLERRDGCTLVDVQITTGRPHQIRIHLAAVGHPLVGDPLYEAGGRPKADSRALPGDLGYHLHSRLLGFAHPVTKEWVEISCAPPPLLRTSGEHLTRTSSP